MRDIIEILGEAILVATFQHPNRQIGPDRIHHRPRRDPDEDDRRGRAGQLRPR